jgi:hypothetical protein
MRRGGEGKRGDSRTSLAFWKKTKKRQRKVKDYFFILLFLDEKKQKSSDYIIC